MEAAGARLVALGEPDYPIWLRSVDGAPPLLTVRGSAACLGRPTVAIVGARNASIAGRKFAMQLRSGSANTIYVVASGLARGIDAAAHEAALAGGTVAVLAGGLDHIYPPENEDLPSAFLPPAVRRSARCRWAGSRGRVIFRDGTESSPASRSAW